jgi:hypothetical protein
MMHSSARFTTSDLALEHWIVDWQLRTIQVHGRKEAILSLIQTLNPNDALTSPLRPGFACSLADLWEPAL